MQKPMLTLAPGARVFLTKSPIYATKQSVEICTNHRGGNCLHLVEQNQKVTDATNSLSRCHQVRLDLDYFGMQ